MGGDKVARITSKSHYEISIDPTVCDGYGYCVELLPANLTFDDWGFPIVKTRVVEAEELEMANHVVQLCPRSAFKLSKVKG